MTLKESANRSLAAQRANWRSPKVTLTCYTAWLGRFLADHCGMRVAEFSVERFANWKLSLKERGYSAESINHFLGAVRAMFRFAEDTEIQAFNMYSPSTIAPAGFTWTECPRDLTPGESDILAIRLDTNVSGVKTGEFFFRTNDQDENPFQFRISGTVLP